jgi:hypothetical protein
VRSYRRAIPERAATPQSVWWMGAQPHDDVGDLALVGSIAEAVADPAMNRRRIEQRIRDDQRNLRVLTRRTALPRAERFCKVVAVFRSVAITTMRESEHVTRSLAVTTDRQLLQATSPKIARPSFNASYEPAGPCTSSGFRVERVNAAAVCNPGTTNIKTRHTTRAYRNALRSSHEIELPIGAHQLSACWLRRALC